MSGLGGVVKSADSNVTDCVTWGSRVREGESRIDRGRTARKSQAGIVGEDWKGSGREDRIRPQSLWRMEEREIQSISVSWPLGGGGK